ncbi:MULTISPECIES: DUF3426 domain-containing protein [unclassified Limnobacter]|uniref:DUF3426 domain-containing protein n=1 Tax=unclassified Limnobacter TaxID=2630203 RepID=UPI000C4F9C4E|nr:MULTISPECIES: DUF3426 domain-containing protein [unclassified Limnobacter]MAZ08925.1 hypothetical protein [Sutterellaceae bacterium]|tara:strand:- start:986 stop:1786 length:801 start_codon:yes stop_codon:yes gene_type:complete
MSLATRCPNCNILFKVTSGQLQMHEGKVRCGHCQTIFSGIEHLTSADTEAWQKLDLSPKHSDTGYTSDHNLTGGDGTGSEALFADTAPSKPLLNFSQGNPVLKVAFVALLLALGLQALWWQRIDLLQQTPDMAKHINTAGPTIQRLFASPATQALRVEGSGLQALDEHNLRVDLTLHNQLPLPALWPHLKVELLDPQGLVLASKSLSPSDYQLRDENAASQAPLIAGEKTVEVLAYLNLSTLNTQLPESAATGFRLELFDQGPGEQ